MIINTDYVAGMKLQAGILNIMMNNTCYTVEGIENIAELALVGDLAQLYMDYIDKEVEIKDIKDCKVCGCDYNKTK